MSSAIAWLFCGRDKALLILMLISLTVVSYCTAAAVTVWMLNKAQMWSFCLTAETHH